MGVQGLSVLSLSRSAERGVEVTKLRVFNFSLGKMAITDNYLRQACARSHARAPQKYTRHVFQVRSMKAAVGIVPPTALLINSVWISSLVGFMLLFSFSVFVLFLNSQIY